MNLYRVLLFRHKWEKTTETHWKNTKPCRDTSKVCSDNGCGKSRDPDTDSLPQVQTAGWQPFSFLPLECVLGKTNCHCLLLSSDGITWQPLCFLRRHMLWALLLSGHRETVNPTCQEKRQAVLGSV